jgi:hypothetical protein
MEGVFNSRGSDQEIEMVAHQSYILFEYIL